MKSKIFKIPVSVILTVVMPTMIIALLAILGYGKTFDRKFSDVMFGLLPSHYKFSDNIVIIDIDENSIAKFADHPEFGQWPWKRNVYSTILSYIHLLTPPKMTLVDVLFTERSDFDESLANANLTYANLSHAANFRDSQKFETLISENKEFDRYRISLAGKSPFPSYEDVAFPIGRIGETSPSIHVVNVIPDSDGVLRRFSPLLQWRKKHFPSLALQSFAEGQNIEVRLLDDILVVVRGKEVKNVPLGEKGLVRAYFYSEEEIRNIPRYSVAGIFESMNQLNQNEVDDPEKLLVPPTLFENKIILIGSSAAATHDDVVLPYGLYPGVIGQAIFSSNMVEGHFLTEISEYWGIFLSFLLLLIGCYILFVNQIVLLKNLYPIIAVFIYFAAFYFLYRNDSILPTSSFILSFPISYMMGFAYLTYTEGKEKRKFNNILRNLVDPGVVTHALEDLDALKKGGEWEITAFFSDVAGFSSISEELSASDLARLLNEYLSAMTTVLKANSGTLDKYIGDAIVGIFGAPVQNNLHSKLACTASLEMVFAMESLRQKWRKIGDYTESARQMNFRIGLNCGPAKVGFMGTESLASYTMMGDTVNLASRLEAAAKDYGVSILVSENIQKSCADQFFFFFLDRIRVKGKDQPVNIYTLVCDNLNVSNEQLVADHKFREAFQYYTEQNWAKAKSTLTEIKELGVFPFATIQMLLERCSHLSAESPGANWDGVYTRTSK
ncbi:adenylate/guanylate cyclase domain-containing protein [Leptospira sp. 96542]|nr:adenylate/guanylate cyclase domain-containing protein [Leptospira sp. 96542]